MRILLLGPQGSGKGTQAERIARTYGIPHIATGDMLRAAMAAGTELGRRVKPIYDAGELVPDDLMIELIRERLSEPDAEEGLVLDGFPRTPEQAEALDDMLLEIGRPLDVVFDLQIDEPTAVERLLGRARDEGRTDDTPEAIATRLELFRKKTLPVIEHYRAQGKVVGIHAAGTVNEVFNEIQETLEQVAAR
ncbi:MAG: adenylate kinase [Actinomycetota bacterium]|nr:adenylate kinase [Actinomycetota bacterium]